VTFEPEAGGQYTLRWRGCEHSSAVSMLLDSLRETSGREISEAMDANPRRGLSSKDGTESAIIVTVETYLTRDRFSKLFSRSLWDVHFRLGTNFEYEGVLVLREHHVMRQQGLFSLHQSDRIHA
jgi:hypothetical protein